MARRVTWTNNSTDYDGTNIYRDTTIDPQNLPAPIATVGPVAQGATVEYIDLTGSGDQCYAVRDFDSSGDGALSEAYCYADDPFQDAQIGDELEGGIYAGTITYADAREFHIIFAKQSGEASAGLNWRDVNGTVSGCDDPDDGVANTDLIESHPDGIATFPAAEHCVTYSSDGYDDWYLPSINELKLFKDLSDAGHPEFSTGLTELRWSSTQPSGSFNVNTFRPSDGVVGTSAPVNSTRPTRPIRRVPV